MKKYPLRKSEILTGKKRFNDVFSQGQFKCGKYVSVVYCKSESFRIGFAVSGKIKGNAKRNKLKRHLREIFRRNRKEFPDNVILILILSNENYYYSLLKNDVINLIKSINYISP